MRWTLLVAPAAVLLFASALVSAAETASPAPTSATAASPPATIAPATTVTDTVTRVTASEELQRAALARLEESRNWRELERQAVALEADVDALRASATQATASLDPIDLDRQLRALHRSAAIIAGELATIVRRLEHDASALEADARNWQERLSFLEKRLVPAPVLERARSVEAEIRRTDARVREYRNDVLLALDRALVLQARIDGARSVIGAQQERVRSQRRQLEQSSLWRLATGPAEVDLVAAELRAAWRVLRDYLVREGTALAGLFLGVLVLTAWLFTRRSLASAGSVERAYGRPLAASLLIALMSLVWLAPDPPRLFYEALFVLLPIPAAMVARRALTVPIPLTLYGIAIATMLLPMRGALDASPIVNRVLLLLQVVSIAVPVAIDLRYGRLQQALRWATPGVVRALAVLVLVVAVVSAFFALFGFSSPASSVRAGMGSVTGAVLILGTTAVALYGAVLALLATPVIQSFRSARNADLALLRAVRLTLGALAVAGVILVTLGSLGLTPALRAAIESLMGATLEVGTVSIAASAVATALAVIFATVVLTGVTGFVLDREIMPRLHLRPGAGYAVVTFTRWSMLIVGAVLSLAALGIDTTKLTLLAGALSVGIGFGLQNVVNNFVSGLILIVERPVGVGDVIERGTLSGKVTRIGIRSSTVRTGQGAEVIVPNAELVSKEVVNWTRSDRQRRYDIDVAVAPGPEPEKVMRLIEEAASDVPDIMAEPPPRAVFKGFHAGSLDFTLLAWVPTIDVGLQAQNALRVAILRKLTTAGITIA